MTQATVFGYGPDYEGLIPATADIKVKCSLLVDFLYFYNIVPLHGQEHVINSTTDNGKIIMVFCDPMSSDVLSKY